MNRHDPPRLRDDDCWGPEGAKDFLSEHFRCGKIHQKGAKCVFLNIGTQKFGAIFLATCTKNV